MVSLRIIRTFCTFSTLSGAPLWPPLPCLFLFLSDAEWYTFDTFFDALLDIRMGAYQAEGDELEPGLGLKF